MTARPKDWSPLYDSDPVPGDPYEVAKLGKKLRGMADEIDKQARNIRALASVDSWDSDAGRAFHEIAGDTAGRLQKAYDRYDEAAKALGTKVREDDGESDEYASELRRAQRNSEKGLQEYREAEVDYKAAAKVLDPLDGKVLTGEDAVTHSKQQKKKDDAAQLMVKAEGKILQARNAKDDAARKAARRIKNVIHHDGVKDPGGIMDWFADHADFFSGVATFLAAAALIAAVVLSGGTLAVVLVAAAAAMSATALTGRLYDYFGRGGKLDLMAMTMDVLGIIPGLGALKGLTAAAKGARLMAAQKGIWMAFTNGFAAKNFNKGVVWASKWLSNKGITKIKLPAEGFNPEVITRFIKGGALTNLAVGLGIAHHTQDRPDKPSSPPGDARPTPSPDLTPDSDNSGGSKTPTPTPRPSPSPSSTSFNAALAPAG